MTKPSTDNSKPQNVRTSSNLPRSRPPLQPSQALPSPAPDYRPTGDEWAAWCQHPVTRFVAAGHQTAADAQRDEWDRMSWSLIPLNEVLRATLMARADAYSAFNETSLEGYVKIMERFDG